MDVDQLITDVDSTDTERSQRAKEKLIALGVEVIQSIAEAIERAGPYSPGTRLHDILGEIADPAVVPQFISLLDATNASLSITAFKALGNSGDERALPPLLVRLARTEEFSTPHLAACALGELGDLRAMKPLLEAARSILHDLNELDVAFEKLLKEVKQDWSADPLRLLIAFAISLAKLGNHTLTPILVNLVRFNPGESGLSDLDDIQIVRAEAAEGLCHTVAAGMLPALNKAVCEGNAEIRAAALEALFYLGLPESIEVLLSCIDDSDQVVAVSAQIWLNRITGTDFEPFEDDPVDIRAWWDEHRTEFASGVCHRLGKPLSVKDIVDQLGVPNLAPDIVRELRIITGKNLARDQRRWQNEDMLTLGRRWWKSQRAGRFVPGWLYKYGRNQDLTSVF